MYFERTFVCLPRPEPAWPGGIRPASRPQAVQGGARPAPPPAEFRRRAFRLLAGAGAGVAGGHRAVLRAVDDAGAPELRRGGHDGDLALLPEAGQSAQEVLALGRGEVVLRDLL